MTGQSFSFTLPKKWMEELYTELQEPYMLELAAFLEKEYFAYPGHIFPQRDEIFSAFVMTPFDKVKVVLVGQDPYHRVGQAQGLSFSVRPGVKVPPSLHNIYKELQSDLNITPPSSGSLISWANEGVLLLNATLTVRKGEPMSHHNKGWERFTDRVVETLLRKKKNIVFMLWGKNAQEKCLRFKKLFTNHLVLQAAHPSPYSAHNGFLGCRHFSQANQYLEKHDIEPISWKL